MIGDDMNNPNNDCIDCIVDINGSNLVLIRRAKEPYAGMWALPGGRQAIGEELEQTVVRELKEETGLTADILKKGIPLEILFCGQRTFLDQLRTYMSGTDPRGGNTTVHAIQYQGDISTIRRCLTNGSDADKIGIFDRYNLPELAFDHKRFIEDYYMRLKRYNNPIPTTDVIIIYREGIVLIERKNPPYGLALPGGFAEYGMTLEGNAEKEAKEETNLDINILNPGRPYVFSAKDRDPRDHMISNTFIACGYGVLRAGDDAKSACIVSIDEAYALSSEGKLAFDHNVILETCLKDRLFEYLSEE
jgi:8-oxo-dGTP diphosphatase